MRSLSKLFVASLLVLGACFVKAGTTPVETGGPPPPPAEHGPRAAVLTGVVMDAASHQPIGRVGVDIVQVQGHALVTRARTDETGHYQTDGVPPGTYLVRVEYSGYKLMTRSMDLRPGTTELEIGMDHQ